MDLSKILSISGKSGLFKMIAQTKNGLIVESLIEKKRMPAFSHDKISSLDEISVFTNGEDLPLNKVFKLIYEKQSGGPAVDYKSDDKTLKKFFKDLVPDYDETRVYTSHIKKILKWYNILQKENLLDFTEEEKEKDEDKGDDKEVKESESPADKLTEKEKKAEEE